MADIDSDRQKKLIYKSKRATAKYVKHTAVVFLLYFQVFRVILSKSIRSQLHVLGLLFCYFLFYLFIYLFFWYLRNVSSIIAFASMIAYAQCLLC